MSNREEKKERGRRSEETYRRLARTITASKGTSTIGRGPHDLGEDAQLSKALGIAQGDEGDAVVGKEGEGSEGCGLDTSVLRGRADEETSKLPMVATCNYN